MFEVLDKVKNQNRPKYKFLIITFGDMDGIISAALLRKYISEKFEDIQEPVYIQTLYNGPDLITSLAVLKNRYLKYYYDAVFSLNMHKNLNRLKLYLKYIKIADIRTGQKVSIYDHVDYNYSDIIEEYNDIIDVNINISPTMATTLTKHLPYILPNDFDLFVKKVMRYDYYLDLKLLVDAYACDTRVLSALEHYITTDFINNPNPNLRENKDLIPLFDEYKHFVENIGKYINTAIERKGKILIFNRDVLFNSRLSDRIITMELHKVLNNAFQLYLIVDSDYRSTYIRYYVNQYQYSISKICRGLSLNCRGFYTHLTPEEIIEKIRDNIAFSHLLDFVSL